MKAIAIVDSDWGIGCGGSLLVRIPEDMQFFKQMTVGKVVIMGRETFESLPGKQPLADRVNIVLSRNAHFRHEKVTICRSLGELFGEISKYQTDEVFVIGGELVYTQLLPYCTKAYVTKIFSQYTADRHFINLDGEAGWTLESLGELKTEGNIKYRFNTYINHYAVKTDEILP